MEIKTVQSGPESSNGARASVESGSRSVNPVLTAWIKVDQLFLSWTMSSIQQSLLLIVINCAISK